METLLQICTVFLILTLSEHFCQLWCEFFSPCFLSLFAALHPCCQLELGGAARSSSAFVDMFYRTINPPLWCAELMLCPCVSAFKGSHLFSFPAPSNPWERKKAKNSLQDSCSARGIHAGRFLLMGDRSWSPREMFANCFALKAFSAPVLFFLCLPCMTFAKP